MATRPLFFFVLSTLACACATDPTNNADCFDGKCDGPSNATCADTRYGDGTCQTDLACPIPDIDCFVTFDNDASAQQWFSGFEMQLAAEQNRAPRRLVPESDPRFTKIRALLDRGWEAFAANRPVGELKHARPGLVMIEDPVVNAFVAPNVQRTLTPFTVMVQTGLLERNLTDEATLGVMMHELQHAVGLHLIADTKQKLVRYYVSPPGNEQIGRVQPNNPGVQKLASDWLELSSNAGSFSTAALGGYPVTGDLNTILVQVISRGNQLNPQGCARTSALYMQLQTALQSSRDALTGALLGDPNVWLATTNAMMQAAQTECLPTVHEDLIAVIAATSNQSYSAIEQSMPASDVALIKGQHVITGIANLTADKRAKMRATEAAFEQLTGSPWTSLRYFSFEEDADDVSVPVMRAAGYSPEANGEFMLHAGLSADAATACKAQIDTGLVPHYGVDIGDPHHATCWRVYHTHAIATWSQRKQERTLPGAPVRPPTQYHLPLPVRLSDSIAY